MHELLEARGDTPEGDSGEPVSEVVARLLFESIAEVVAVAQRALCAHDPNDFTRSRKVPLGMLPSALVHWAQDTVAGEIHDFWGWDALAPNSSAFALQWKKFSDFAMPTLLHTLVCKFVGVAYVGRWHLVAADDTGMRVPETGDERTRVRSNQSGASHDELPERILRVKGKIRINRRWRRGSVLFRWPAPAFVHA